MIRWKEGHQVIGSQFGNPEQRIEHGGSRSSHGCHSSEARHEIALLDFDNAHPAFDQSGPAMDIAHDPSLEPRFRRLVWSIRWRRRDRARNLFGLLTAVAGSA